MRCEAFMNARCEIIVWSHWGLPGTVWCGNWKTGAREVKLPAAAWVTHRTTHYEG